MDQSNHLFHEAEATVAKEATAETPQFESSLGNRDDKRTKLKVPKSLLQRPSKQILQKLKELKKAISQPLMI